MRYLPKYSIPLLILATLVALGARYSKPATDLRDAYSRPAAEWPAPTLDSNGTFRELGPLPAVTYPPDNPYSKARAALGKRLFFDPVLSGSNQIACATCHDPELGWGDGRRTSFGHDRQLGTRNAPTLLNAGHWETFFWDGRAATLEEQALFPIQDPIEMNQDLASLPAELSTDSTYRQSFQEAFGSPEVTVERIAQALATFERGIRSRKSRFDRFMEGNYSALNDDEIAGLHLFRTKAKCINCHNGPFLTDQQFHNNGQSHFGRPGEDLGLFNITGDSLDMGKFRTPSLRDVVFTGPYLHHGNIVELDEVLFMYDQGMPQIIPKRLDGTRQPAHSPILQPLGLTETERNQLKAFLHALSTRPRSVALP
jgi:cytochrome c peroxidase